MKKKIILLLSNIFLISSLISSNLFFQNPEIPEKMSFAQKTQINSTFFTPKNQGLPHATIIINLDSDFTPGNGVVMGSGSVNDPYIIANWTVDGIHIYNSTSFFIIQNCTLPTGGISFTNVTNGKINNSSCKNANVAIRFVNCSQIIVTNNNISMDVGDAAGIQIINGTNMSIENNVFQNVGNNGIDLIEVSNCSIIGNKISQVNITGITCYNCDNCIIEKNICFNNIGVGISIMLSPDSIIKNNNCSYNELEGIYTYQSPNCSFINNTLFNNFGDGIRLIDDFNCTLRNNYCSYNGGCGILLDNSENNSIIENNCSFNNQNGISLISGTKNNNVISNFLMGNGNTCIYDPYHLNNCVDNECYNSDGSPIDDPSPPSNDDSSPPSNDDSLPPSNDDNPTFLLKMLPWSWIPIILLLLGILLLILMKNQRLNKTKSEELDIAFDTIPFLPSDGVKELETTPKTKKSKKNRTKIKKDRGSKNKKDSDDDITFKSYI